MDIDRQRLLKAALENELQFETEQAGLGPAERATWLAARLEHYVDRWLGFCDDPTIPLSALLSGDLFGVIEIGADLLDREMRLIDQSGESIVAWQEFVELLSAVRAAEDRSGISSLLRSARRLHETLQ